MNGENIDRLVAPGESGFHVRGKLYLNFIHWVEKVKQKPLHVYLDALEDAELKEYLSQPFTARTWYDAFPIVPLTEVAAQLEMMTFADYMRMRARMQVTEDLSGPLGLFVRVATPAIVAGRLSRLAGFYLDFGTHEQQRIGPRSVHVRWKGVPLYLASWFAYASSTFLECALEAAGGKSPHATVRSHTPEPPTRGFEMVSVDLDVVWR